MGKEGRRFLPNLKKLGSPRLNFDEICFDKNKVHSQMMIIYIDIFGNEFREIRTLDNFEVLI